MTGEEMIKAAGITATFDWAIPIRWVDEMIEKLGEESQPVWAAMRHFIWLYDDKAGLFGRPFPLTTQGNRLLERINAATGSTWPLNPKPLYTHRMTGVLQPISLETFMEQFDEEVRGQIYTLFHQPHVSAIVLYENQNMSSSHLGERTAMVVGKGCTRPNMDAVETDQLGSVPSVFQYPVAYVMKEEAHGEVG